MIGSKGVSLLSLSCYRDMMDRWCSPVVQRHHASRPRPQRGTAARRFPHGCDWTTGRLNRCHAQARRVHMIHKNGKQAVILRTGLGRDRRLHAIRPPALVVPWKSGILRNIPRLPVGKKLERSHDTARVAYGVRCSQPQELRSGGQSNRTAIDGIKLVIQVVTVIAD